MQNERNIIFPCGDYKKLLVYHKSDIIYEATNLFCRRFLAKYYDRTVDQMNQAARSCKQNIVEGSSAAATSLETEIKLIGVARASLDELREDFLDWLKKNSFLPWELKDSRIILLRSQFKENNTWNFWKDYFESCTGEEYCNWMLTLISQTSYLLKKLLLACEENFKQNGGIRERMTAVRKEYRRMDWHIPITHALSFAQSPQELYETYYKIHSFLNQVYSERLAQIQQSLQEK